jgi:hypothetical protein
MSLDPGKSSTRQTHGVGMRALGSMNLVFASTGMFIDGKGALLFLLSLDWTPLD